MKTIRLLPLLALLLFLLAGCSNNDELAASDPVAVQFAAGNIAGLKTRTTAEGTQWMQADPIGIFMVKNGQTLSPTSIAEGADNMKYEADNGNTATTGFSPAGSPIYYPQNGSSVDFIAYYPYNSTLTSADVLPIDVTAQTVPADIDVLYSNNATGYSKTSGTVDLQFKHALSKVNFTLQQGTGSPDLTGASIEISNLHRTADMDLADGSLSNLASQGTVTANSSNYAIVVPQTISSSKLTITLAGNNKYEWDFPLNTTFGAGLQYTYTITVSKTGITVSTSGITTWTGTGDSATPGTAEQIKYKVGDYYPYPDDPGTAIGVVFEITDGAGYRGKIIDLNSVQRYVHVNGVQYGIKWGDPAIDEDAAGVVGIRDMNDGYNGTRNLITERKEQPNFADVYCLFNWIYQTKNNGDINGVWYLPAVNEWKSIMTIRGTLNDKLLKAGGNEILNSIHLALTESSADKAMYVDPSGVVGEVFTKDAANWQIVTRTVRKF